MVGEKLLAIYEVVLAAFTSSELKRGFGHIVAHDERLACLPHRGPCAKDDSRCCR